MIMHVVLDFQTDSDTKQNSTACANINIQRHPES